MTNVCCPVFSVRRPIKLLYERTLKPLFRISMLLDTRTADYRCFVLAVRYLSNDSTEKRGGRVQPCVAAVPWNVTDHAGRTLERDRKTRCCYRSIQPGGIVEETQDVPRGALARAHANMSMTLVRNTFKGKHIFFYNLHTCACRSNACRSSRLVFITIAYMSLLYH